MEWINGWSTPKKERISAANQYNELFASFWKEHGEKVSLLYDNLTNCVEKKTFLYLFTHNGKKEMAKVKQHVNGLRPCINIFLEMPLRENVKDDCLGEGMTGITEILKKFPKTSFTLRNVAGYPYIFSIEMTIYILKD